MSPPDRVVVLDMLTCCLQIYYYHEWHFKDEFSQRYFELKATEENDWAESRRVDLSWKVNTVQDHEKRHHDAYMDHLQQHCDGHMDLLKQAIVQLTALATSVRAYGKTFEGKDSPNWPDGVEMYKRMGAGQKKAS